MQYALKLDIIRFLDLKRNVLITGSIPTENLPVKSQSTSVNKIARTISENDISLQCCRLRQLKCVLGLAEHEDQLPISGSM